MSGVLVGCGGGGSPAPPQPGITVSSPNGGETWYHQGPDRDITWTNTAFSGNVDIHYTINATGDPAGWTWLAVAADVPNTGSHTWAIPNAPGSTCRVRVQEAGGGLADESNADFTISAPAITLNAPVGGESWGTGSTRTITWTGGGFANVRVELTRNGDWLSAEPVNVVGIPPEDGSCQWTVTGPGSANCLVRVSDWDDGVPADESSAPFAIAEIALAAPTGGEEWDLDSSRSITWTSSGVANVRIELSRDGNWTDGDGSDVEVLSASTDAATGSFPWTPDLPVSASCLVRMSDAGASGAVDVSGATFTIAGIEVTSPNGGEVLVVGQEHAITWLSAGVTGNVDIHYTTDTTGDPGSWVWNEIAVGTANTGSHAWPVPAVGSATCRVRVRESVGSLSDYSDDDFGIFPLMAGPFDYGPEVVTTYTWGGSDFVEETRRTYSYDVGGKVTTILEESWGGAAWVNSLLTTYTYNVDDTVDTITVESWNGASWDVNTVTTCNYAGGLMTSKDIDDLSAGTTSRIVYTYTGGLLTREQGEEFDGFSSWTPTDAATYGYDASDRLSSGTIEAPDFFSGALTQVGTLSQGYDAAGLLYSQTVDISFFIIDMLLETGPAIYDATDRLQTTELAVTMSGQPPDVSMAECFYDVSGRLEEVVAYAWDDVASNWVVSGKTTYTNTDAGSSFTFEHETPTPLVTWPWEMYGCGDVNPHLW